MRTKILLSLLFLFQLCAFSQPAIQWQKCLGGTGGDYAYSIKQIIGGGYIVAGGTVSTDGDVTGNHAIGTSDYWIVKLDTGGAILWKKCFGGTGDDYAYSIEQTADTGFI